MIARLARGALVLAALVAAWWFTRGAPAAPAQAPAHVHGAGGGDSAQPVQLSARDQSRIGVTFAPVLRGVLERDVRIVAQVSYDETRIHTVSPRFEGWVERLQADYTGRPVRAGEALLTLYSPMVVSTAEELLLARRLEGELAGDSTGARANAETLVASARERLARWQVPENEIRALESTGSVPRTVTLRSPVNGVIVEKNVLAGQRVMEGDALFRIVDLGVVWLEGDVFEQDLAVVRVGQPVSAVFQALPGTERSGRIGFIAPTLSPETRTARVRVALENPGLLLKPGMFATLRLTAPLTRAVLSVPRSAVLATGERSLVFRKRPDGRFTPTDVVLGAQTGDRLEILRGLSEGDTVVASATFLVDAESNLGTLLGGMGDMPGMDMTAPAPGKE